MSMARGRGPRKTHAPKQPVGSPGGGKPRPYENLLVSQCDDGVDAHGAASGDVAGNQTGRKQRQ